MHQAHKGFGSTSSSFCIALFSKMWANILFALTYYDFSLKEWLYYFPVVGGLWFC